MNTPDPFSMDLPIGVDCSGLSAPRGCWADPPAGDYRPSAGCNDEPETEIGLCLKHFFEIVVSGV